MVGLELRHRTAARPGHDDGATGAGERDGLRERFGRLGRDVDDDVGQASRRIPQRAYRIGVRDVDGKVGAEVGGDGEPFGIRAPRPVTITNAAPASFAAAAAERPRTPGPSTATTSPSEVPGTVTAQRTPAPSGLNSVATTGSSTSGMRWTMVSGPRYWVSA